MRKRVLFFPSYRGSGFGHIGRCLALADAMAERGWEAAFVLGGPHVRRVAGEGWTVFRPPFERGRALFARLRRALRREGSVAYLFFSNLNYQAVRDGFHTAERVRREVEWELEVVRRFDPHLLVGDAWLLTSVVGRLAGLPVVQIVRSAAHPAGPRLVWWREVPPGIRPPDIRPVFNPVLERWGLPPVSRAEDLLDGDLLLVPSIPSLDPLPQGAERTRYVGPLVRRDGGGGEVPAEMDIGSDHRPFIYVTVGGGSESVRGVELLPLWEEAFAGTGWEVVVSTGGRPTGKVTGRAVRVFPWVPGPAMVSRADLVLFHGGYGTMMETVRAGVPSVVVPFHAEQEANGRRLQQNGAAEVLGPWDEHLERVTHRWAGGEFSTLVCRRLFVSAGDLREVVGRVLDDSRYRAAALRLSEEQARYGGAPQAAQFLIDLGWF